MGSRHLREEVFELEFRRPVGVIRSGDLFKEVLEPKVII
jgi:hypothetical protein